MRTVVIAEEEFWAPGADFAAALRHRGYRSIRLLPDTASEVAGSRARRALEGLASDVVFEAVLPSGALTQRGLAALARAHAIDLQGTEPVLEWLSENGRSEQVGRRSSRLPVTSIIDKVRLTQFLESAGIAVPHIWEDVSEVPANAPFPLMVKVRNGGGGTGIVLCHSFYELGAAVRSLQGATYFVQEFHDGPTRDVAGVAKDGQVVQLITYQNLVDPLHPFSFAYGITVTDDPVLADYTRRVVAALGMTGPFALDAVPDAHGRPLLIDANPRIWGCWTACQAAGMDVLGAYEYALDLGPRPPDPVFRPGTSYSLLRTPPLGVQNRRQRARWLARELRTVRQRSSWMGRGWARVTALRLASWAARGPALPTTPVP
jgi:ATP-grasp domain